MQAYSDPKREQAGLKRMHSLDQPSGIGPEDPLVPVKFGRGFIAQAWNGEQKLSEIEGLSYDAARHIAMAATLTGHTGRLMGEDQDWCEVWTPTDYRSGTFAQTTLVAIEAR